MIKASIIVPTRNRASYLLDNLLSLQKQNFPKDEYEIIVVDNGSTDNTKQVVEKISKNEGPKINYIFEKNIGLHFVRHTGARVAKGEILAYSEDDTISDKNWLKELVNPFDDSEIVCVGGKMLPRWEIKPPEWIKKFPLWYLGLLDEGDQEKETPMVLGGNFTIRKSLLFQVGGFNPDAFADKSLQWYRADGECGLFRKIQKTGKKIIYTPKAIAWHIITKERITLDYFRDRAFRIGIENAFVDYYYAYQKPGNLKILFKSSEFYFRFSLNKILAIFYKILKKDDYYIRECESLRNKARFQYFFKLASDKKFKEEILNFKEKQIKQT